MSSNTRLIEEDATTQTSGPRRSECINSPVNSQSQGLAALTRITSRVLCLLTLIIIQTGCIAMHYRNPLRQSIEYKAVTRRLGDERLARVKQHERERPPLRDDELGTEAARFEGVFLGRADEGTKGGEVLIATQNFNKIEFSEREQVPYKIDERTIVDEATLMSREPKTCVDLVLNTETLYERSIEDLEVLFEVDSEEVEFTVVEERSMESSMWFKQRFYWVFLHEELFEYTTRVAMLCADTTAREVVTLSLRNELYSVRDGELWQLTFRWFLAGR